MKNSSSRRSFFKYMTALGLTSFYTSALYAKTTKDIVNYQPQPKDGNRCKTCMHFIPKTNECATVAGTIDPNGWCKLYFTK
jgi:high potential iron-sulfur protein